MKRKVKTPRIAHPEEKTHYWAMLFVLIILSASAWQSYQWGIEQGQFGKDQLDKQWQQCQTHLQQLQQSNQQLNEQKVHYQQAAEIEKQASQSLKNDLARLEQQKSALQKERDMLLELIADSQSSLYIRDFSLKKTKKKGQFAYRLTVVQVLDQYPKTQGKLVFKLVGYKKNKKMTLSGSSFLVGGKKSILLSFKHYQDVEGLIQLPKGFKPSRLQIEVLPNHAKMKKLVKIFDWAPQSSG